MLTLIPRDLNVNQEPSLCEVIVLATPPPCSPALDIEKAKRIIVITEEF